MNDDRMQQPVPISTSYVCAYVIRREAHGYRFLLLKRKSQYMFGLWQQVAGKVEEGETAVEAVLREIKEETGVCPKALYSANTIESFYDIEHGVIMMIPAFVAILDESSEIELSHEHSEFKWLSADDAKKLLTFHLQRNTIDLISEVFLRNEPPEALRIDIP